MAAEHSDVILVNFRTDGNPYQGTPAKLGAIRTAAQRLGSEFECEPQPDGLSLKVKVTVNQAIDAAKNRVTQLLQGEPTLHLRVSTLHSGSGALSGLIRKKSGTGTPAS